MKLITILLIASAFAANASDVDVYHHSANHHDADLEEYNHFYRTQQQHQQRQLSIQQQQLEQIRTLIQLKNELDATAKAKTAKATSPSIYFEMTEEERAAFENGTLIFKVSFANGEFVVTTESK
jgi:hypothetical protein